MVKNSIYLSISLSQNNPYSNEVVWPTTKHTPKSNDFALRRIKMESKKFGRLCSSTMCTIRSIRHFKTESN
ncbi:hypothetical protein L1987_43779 [Smallanthus sonchifolius]|uniref:Uncharacterized protein n=1 Tax=Smallanthus sonchifolius TaxID=185202 RepID=A0ACB9GNU3_9ASTR|nr:hypothetical protein L1987_43779 [Smallanthus sonchifolius]